jgi:hypothetical protein
MIFKFNREIPVMKLSTAFVCVAAGLLMNTIVFADNGDNTTNTTPSKVHLSQVIALDANRDMQITSQSIHKGTDTFIAREITDQDSNPQSTFIARDGKTYMAVTFTELQSLDKNKNGVLQADELQYAKSPLLTARVLEDSDGTIIVERPLSMSIKSITLPKADQTTTIGLSWDNNQILIQQIAW